MLNLVSDEPLLTKQKKSFNLLLPENDVYKRKILIFNEWNKNQLIDEFRIKEFYQGLKEEKIVQPNGDPYSNSSINLFLASLKEALTLSFTSFQGLEGKAKLDNFFKQNLRYLEVDKAVLDTKIFTDSELKVLIDKAPMKTLLLIKFLYYTGLRISEAISIRVKEIFQNNEDAIIIIRRGKRSKERKVDGIPLKLLNEIKSEFNSKEFLFENHNPRSKNGKYTRQHWHNELSKISKNYLGRNLAPHFLRHSHATALANIGVSYGAIQRRLGHKNASTTLEIYDRSKVSKNDLKTIRKNIEI
ncbi:MAG: site-specific integrase [Leptospiraceae bacterium]|nr:site-specific integrase [Leptospiraceae bacterium]